MPVETTTELIEICHYLFLSVARHHVIQTAEVEPVIRMRPAVKAVNPTPGAQLVAMPAVSTANIPQTTLRHPATEKDSVSSVVRQTSRVHNALIIVLTTVSMVTATQSVEPVWTAVPLDILGDSVTRPRVVIATLSRHTTVEILLRYWRLSLTAWTQTLSLLKLFLTSCISYCSKCTRDVQTDND